MFGLWTQLAGRAAATTARVAPKLSGSREPVEIAFATRHVCDFLFRSVCKQATVTEPQLPPVRAERNWEAEEMDFF